MKNNTSLGALLTMLAMLCFASMDAISKSLVVDYPVWQLMWVRSGLLCLFAWFLVRKQGVRAALRSKKPGLQIFRSLVAVVEGAAFVMAFRYLPLADTHAVAATSPLMRPTPTTEIGPLGSRSPEPNAACMTPAIFCGMRTMIEAVSTVRSQMNFGAS